MYKKYDYAFTNTVTLNYILSEILKVWKFFELFANLEILMLRFTVKNTKLS